MNEPCKVCGKSGNFIKGNEVFCHDHVTGLVDLNEMMNELAPDEKRTFLKKFYDGAYKNNMYSPQNGLYAWEWIIDRTGIVFVNALDVGCGTGVGLKYAVDRGKDVYGIDFADAREEWKKYGVEDRCKIASALDIPYPDNSFDLVVCLDVMEHIPEGDSLNALKEIRRVGSRAFIFAIALTLEKEPVGKKVLTHINVKNANWWIQKMSEAGYGAAVFKNGNQAVQYDDHHIRAFLTKDC